MRLVAAVWGSFMRSEFSCGGAELEWGDLLFHFETLSYAVLLITLHSHETASNDSGRGPAL